MYVSKRQHNYGVDGNVMSSDGVFFTESGICDYLCVESFLVEMSGCLCDTRCCWGLENYSLIGNN